MQESLPPNERSRTLSVGFVVFAVAVLLIVVSLCVLLVVNGLTAAKVTEWVVESKSLPSPSPKPATFAALDSFERSPDAAHWTTLHEHMVGGPLTPEIETRLVNVLVTRDLPKRLVDAVTVDLSTNVETDALRDLRNANIVSQIGNDPASVAEVKRSSLIAWLMLALRSSYEKGGLDLTRMDLRAGGSFVGQGMNLTSVDFGNTHLAGGQWRRSNLTFAQFSGVTIDQPLTCTACSWGDIRVAKTVRLTDGTWLLP